MTKKCEPWSFTFPLKESRSEGTDEIRILIELVLFSQKSNPHTTKGKMKEKKATPYGIWFER